MDEVKISSLLQMAGGKLIKGGIDFYQRSFRNLTPTIFSFGEVKNICIENGINVIQNDKDFFYSTTSWDNWQRVIETDFIDDIKWIAEKGDCDNLALLFASLSIILLRMNSCAYAYCLQTNTETGANVLHYFNVILTSDRKLYAYEPQNDKWVKIEKGKPIILGNKKYDIKSLTFF